MSEDLFLIILGLSFGLPAMIAVIIFGVCMMKHSQELDEISEEIDAIEKRREFNEKRTIK